MSHPMNEHRQHRVEKSRVASMTKNCRASGGRVHEDEAQDRKLFGKMLKETKAPEGKKAKHRRDRVTRARGGKVGHKKGATHVNVIVNGGKEPVPVPVPAGGPPMPPPAMGAPPPGPVAGLGGPPPGAGAPPPMMPPRKRGGRVKHRDDGGEVSDQTKNEWMNSLNKGRARGGKVKSGPAWEEGLKAGTQVSHRAGKATTNTPENLDRGRQVTFATGGGVVSFKARGGAVEAQGKPGKQMGPKLPGGVVAGETRLAQASHAKRGYAKPMREVDGAK